MLKNLKLIFLKKKNLVNLVNSDKTVQTTKTLSGAHGPVKLASGVRELLDNWHKVL